MTTTAGPAASAAKGHGSSSGRDGARKTAADRDARQSRWRCGRRAKSRAGSRRSASASEIVIIRTSGDRASEAAPTGALPTDASGKRLFVKEIEDAVLAGSIDLAVHSTKDCRSCCQPAW